MRFPSTLLAQKAEPEDIQKADLDLLDKINKVAGELGGSSSTASKGHLWGLTLSNGADATNDIDIGIGEAVDNSDGSLMVLAAGLTKQLDAAWAVGTNAGGRDTGAIADGWWAVWLIMRSDTGVVDALFSLSATAPSMPAGYTKKRRIGWIHRTSGAIDQFTWADDWCTWKALVNDLAYGAIADANRHLLTVSAPPNSIVVTNVVNGGTGDFWVATSDLTDAAASTTNRTGHTAATFATTEMKIKVNSSSQIAYRTSSAGAVGLQFETSGFIDTRGRLA